MKGILNIVNPSQSPLGKGRGHRNKGSVFLIAIIIGMIVLTAGLGLMNIFMKELRFSSDFVFSEMAYYAAESGVEEALLMLEEEPVQHLVPDETSRNPAEHGIIDFELGTMIHLRIDNLRDNFDFNLKPKENVKFRLKKDTDFSKNNTLEVISDWKVTVQDLDGASLDNAWSWKIACQKADDTVSIQGRGGTGSNGNYNNFVNETGKEVNETVTILTGNHSISTFFSGLNETEKQTCFFSATNLQEDKTLTFNFENSSYMSPHKTTITSIGKNNFREKIIKFDYAQKNLGGLFDFVLFHSD